ncbi:hypothetical protein GRI89_05070 [Altererythrobacter salegens]|uniref:Polynucleotide kinase-phosphatase ligase domain-containing protein n=1 Tax=Croceibacterium salegens TaxID=1737568 RepID=A0A6I4SV39_9SPHN|nr:hypothetical protein [Croceibacterium salegens]
MSHRQAKRSTPLREFASGHEAHHRFVEHAPLTRMHHCAFCVLAMENVPVDPRLRRRSLKSALGYPSPGTDGLQPAQRSFRQALPHPSTRASLV